jgi:hypothetical protein
MAVFPFDTNRLIELCRKNDVAMIGIFGSIKKNLGAGPEPEAMTWADRSPRYSCCTTTARPPSSRRREGPKANLGVTGLYF